MPVRFFRRADAVIPVDRSRPLAFCVQHWQQLRAAIADPYRPEQHYMRGPGPKCQAIQRANTVTR